jgi:hypothetical protein
MMRTPRVIVAVCTTLLLSACTANYQVIRRDSNPLAATDSYCISTPADGTYGEIHYAKSGAMTRDLLFTGLTERGIRATRTDATKKNDAIDAARQQGYSRLIYPAILHWEDRATEWSGRRDRAKIDIEIIDAVTSRSLDHTTLDLVGTWWTLGGLHPQDLVEEALEDYFVKLFGQRN